MRETFDRDVFYNNVCFVTYKIYGDTISIIDYYCDISVRHKGYMLQFMTEFINEQKSKGIKRVLGYTDKRNNGWERSERLLLKFGFKYLKTEDENYNHYIMEL
jgi:RimJ/RimL family protein N-acetyltransferase